MILIAGLILPAIFGSVTGSPEHLEQSTYKCQKYLGVPKNNFNCFGILLFKIGFSYRIVTDSRAKTNEILGRR